MNPFLLASEILEKQLSELLDNNAFVITELPKINYEEEIKKYCFQTEKSYSLQKKGKSYNTFDFAILLKEKCLEAPCLGI